ncbi:MAG TPA: prolyl oligopeptidase family serine peptidase [Luteimonas sp.]|nr:prolyl oligopeptidase family serine peptidase [Luteimonas sp.]HRO26355.1 prolyl oligopeptidase family serine peptidase [Luteimonas sp.]HRP72851.1 prolyl oligopeptidase family serine peptidase [Luteimonas sp.]
MRPARLLPFVLLACMSAAQATEPPLAAFPAPPKGEPVTETKFGITTVDPYRRLEDLKDPEVQAWMKAQAARSRTILDAIPGRADVLADIDRLSMAATSQLENAELLEDGRLLLLRQEAGDDIARLILREGIDGARERVLVDPEDWRKRTGKPHAINYFTASPDGSKVLVGISESGSEQAEVHVIDLASGKTLEPPISRVWFPPSWLPDGSGFAYNRINELAPDQPVSERQLNSQAYLHRLGTDAAQDPVIFGSRHDPALGITPAEMPFVGFWAGSASMLASPMTVDSRLVLYAAPRAQLDAGPIRWKKVVDRDQQVRSFAPHGEHLYLLRSDVPNRQIERLSLADGSREIVVPEGSQPIEQIATRADALYFLLKSATGVGSELRRLPWGATAPVAVGLPGLQSVWMMPSHEKVPGMLLGGTGWSRFPTVVRVDADGTVADTALQPQPEGVDPASLTVTIAEVPSHDGTLVPLSIVHRKDLALDGGNPTLLQGYSAYGFSTSPGLVADHFAYFDRGFVRAFCHARGGGDKGEAWYRAGFQATKSNTWKDFNACAQYLVDKGYTSTSKLGALGGSAGGILIGNAMVERPDLYRVMFPSVGVMDSIGAAIRDPNGPANWPEFGDPNTEDGYRSLHGMSSYQKLRDGTPYPATMLIHGAEDPRVAVWHSNKFAARLQEASNSGLPVLLRLDYEAGHGMGATQSQINAERADLISFMLWQFGDNGFQPVLTEAGASAD